MTKSKLMTIFGTVTCGLVLTFSVVAQQGAATSVKTGTLQRPSVALVDVEYIISQNASIEKQMTVIDEKYKKLIQETLKERQEITQMREMLTNYDRNSEAYRETEQKMLARVSEFESKQLLLLKQGTAERLALFNSVYSTIMKQAERCANSLGMSIVLNYNRTKLLDEVPLFPNPQQYDAFFMQYAQSVAGRSVVWANTKTVDMTSLVLGEIQKADPSTRKTASTTVKAQTVNANTAVGTRVAAPAVAPTAR